MDNLVFDYSKLRGKIKEVYKTQAAFAEAMPMSSVSLSDKLNNKVQFSQKEIDRACDLLQISKEEIPIYFFTPKVKEA
jgi:transcriptional regulator with XRE-family HTH domain